MSMLLANKFLSTPSARRATRRMQEPRETRSISIHALRKEGDAHRIRRWDSITQFLSTPSARRATWRLLLYMGKVCNFYPRPPRGGRLLLFAIDHHVYAISIHALREEGDHRKPLRGVLCIQFLSTPSARRATIYRSGSGMVRTFLSTPSARRATAPTSVCAVWPKISIHALREEGDFA